MTPTVRLRPLKLLSAALALLALGCGNASSGEPAKTPQPDPSGTAPAVSASPSEPATTPAPSAPAATPVPSASVEPSSTPEVMSDDREALYAMHLAEARNHLGTTGNAQRAQAEFKFAAQIFPQKAEPFRELARMAAGGGDLRYSRYLNHLAIDRESADADAWFGLIKVQQALERGESPGSSLLVARAAVAAVKGAAGPAAERVLSLAASLEADADLRAKADALAAQNDSTPATIDLRYLARGTRDASFNSFSSVNAGNPLEMGLLNAIAFNKAGLRVALDPVWEISDGLEFAPTSGPAAGGTPAIRAKALGSRAETVRVTARGTTVTAFATLAVLGEPAKIAVLHSNMQFAYYPGQAAHFQVQPYDAAGNHLHLDYGSWNAVKSEDGEGKKLNPRPAVTEMLKRTQSHIPLKIFFELHRNVLVIPAATDPAIANYYGLFEVTATFEGVTGTTTCRIEPRTAAMIEAESKGIRWENDYEAALTKARTEGKWVFILYTAVW